MKSTQTAIYWSYLIFIDTCDDSIDILPIKKNQYGLWLEQSLNKWSGNDHIVDRDRFLFLVYDIKGAIHTTTQPCTISILNEQKNTFLNYTHTGQCQWVFNTDLEIRIIKPVDGIIRKRIEATKAKSDYNFE